MIGQAKGDVQAAAALYSQLEEVDRIRAKYWAWRAGTSVNWNCVESIRISSISLPLPRGQPFGCSLRGVRAGRVSAEQKNKRPPQQVSNPAPRNVAGFPLGSLWQILASLSFGSSVPRSCLRTGRLGQCQASEEWQVLLLKLHQCLGRIDFA